MEFKVRLFLGDELIDPSDYDKIRINCPDVDRIVNEIYERNERRPLIEREPPAVPTDDHAPQPAAPGNEEPLPVPGQESPYASAANGEQNAEGPEQPTEGPLQESESFGEGFARPEVFPERHDEHDPSETFDHTDPEPSMDAPSEQMDRQMPPTIAG